MADNPMRRIRLEKVVVNIGVGEPGERLEKAEEILKRIVKTVTGVDAKPIRTVAKKKIPKWGIRPGLAVGVKVTLRGDVAEKFLRAALDATGNKVPEQSFDQQGNFSFGIREYIDIPGIRYDPSIGIIGMDVCASLERPGYRVKRRKLRRSKVGKTHVITKEDAVAFAKENLGLEVV